MFFRIIKKDLKHKIGINIILFLFMMLATIFVASSVSNILVILNTVDYGMEKGKVGDAYYCTYEMEGEKTLSQYLDQSDLVESYSKNEAVIIQEANIESLGNKKGKDIELGTTVMIAPKWKHNMLLFDKNKEEISVSDGEIAVPENVLTKFNLSFGDTMKFKMNGKNFSYKVTKISYDPAFGGDFTGMQRWMISDHDFEQLKDAGVSIAYNYNVNSDDMDQLSQKINREAFNILVTIDKDMLRFTYMLPLIIAGMLIIVGVCLIVIAFLILRFTIVFTLSEDYREIGIMKAIGIKNGYIRNIYLAKYFLLVSVASAIGCILSVPISNLMIDAVTGSMLVENAQGRFWVNILCAVLVAVTVMAMCYLCTSRLRKFSAIEAIRSGQNGERFSKKAGLSLHRRKRMNSIFFLGFNDVLSNIKRYVVLILTFMIGILLIILPLNTLSTFQSDEMAENFGVDLRTDFLIDVKDITDSEEKDVATSLTMKSFLDKKTEIEKKLGDQGYDVDIETLVYYTLFFYAQNQDESVSELSVVPTSMKIDGFKMLDGSRPENEDEVAFSEPALKKLGVEIGDTVYAKINGEEKRFIVTGSYSNYMQMGNSAYLSPKMEMKDMRAAGCFYYQAYLNKGTISENEIEELKKEMPEYKFLNHADAVDDQLGETNTYMEKVKYLFVAIICLINVLITVLMVNIFIKSEKSQIAMLRSLGFSVNAIRLRFMVRFVIVLIISTLLAVAGSFPCNRFGLQKVFGLMGAEHVSIVVNPWESYVGYPLLLLVVVCAAAFVVSGGIKKLNIMDINNQE